MVTTLPRLAFACACGLACSVAHAQGPWSLSTATEAAYGYNDNVLLSHSGQARSGFARGRAELFLFNLPQGPLDCSILAEAWGTRYFSTIIVDDQRVDQASGAWINAEPGYRITEQLKLSLPLVGYYRDEVLDVSDTEVVRRVAAWRLYGGSLAPTLRWAFHPAWSLEASASGDRRKYHDHFNDSRLGAGELRLHWKISSRVETRLTATRRWRDYDARAQYNARGFEIPGSHLKVAEREGEIRVDVAWDEAERWRTSTRLGILDYRDNGSGFFDYRDKGIAQELEWKSERWLVRVEGAAQRLDFDVQTVGLGLAPPPLLKDHFSAELRLERTLSRRWVVFAEYAWERRRSNERVESYRVNEGLLGLRWKWSRP